MKTKELIKVLKRYPGDAEVLVMKDWEHCPVEEGIFIVDDECLVGISEEQNICEQVTYIDQGLDWEEVHQVIIG